MNLFQIGDFDLHSGSKAGWKIDCDALTEGDIEAIALMIAEQVPANFSSIYGIPRGGARLAIAMTKYASTSGPTLIVDDVLTTGASMEKARQHFNEIGRGVFGAVIFARGRCPSWIKPVFAMQQ